MRIGLLLTDAAAAPPGLSSDLADGAGGALGAAVAALQARAIPVGHDDARLPRCDAIIVAGGQGGNAGDGGAAAGGSPALRAVAAFAAGGGPVLGIGEGFHALCRVGLLPGRFAEHGPVSVAVAGAVHLRVEGRPTPFTFAIPAGRVMRLGGGALPGRYLVDDADQLEQRGQIVFRYCDAAGGATDTANPTRSIRSIAGVCNPRGNVVAVVTQPRAGDDANQLIQSLLLHLRAGVA
jgi:phosphoribosylformylglycinamidine synthase